MHHHTCVVCETPFKSRFRAAKYCDRPCKFKAYNAVRIVDGRLADYRAKNRERRNKYMQTYGIEKIACSVCGEVIFKKTTHKNRQFVCGDWCRGYLRFGKWPSSDIPVLHPIRSTLIPLDHPCRVVPPKVRFMAGVCIWCSRWFIADRLAYSNHTDRVCSYACGKKHAKQVRRATENVKGVIGRSTVFARDVWMCKLCGVPVDKTAVVPHPMAATVDHIIPIVAGGLHVIDNLQTAHFICNTRKGSKIGI